MIKDEGNIKMKLRNRQNGEIVEVIGFEKSNHDEIRMKFLSENDNKVKLCVTDKLASLYAVWEVYEEPKGYWYIDFDGDVLSCVEPFDDETEEKRKAIGNYFETKEEAKRAVEKLKAWKRLKDKGFNLSAVVDNFFCLDIYIKGKAYEEIKEDLKIIFGGEK